MRLGPALPPQRNRHDDGQLPRGPYHPQHISISSKQVDVGARPGAVRYRAFWWGPVWSADDGIRPAVVKLAAVPQTACLSQTSIIQG